ncbi:helix-turn-helix domain-containing protein [Lentilactobacillus parabuchneri]|uniref:helix-turn-helix domain-containing protein n=1 Tax=Lentilactobacillus parabuchneri TaxID=152331 RepID=UPI00094739D7|nr:helix-turn-helix domain-containing protein [Lentilactobacillus parabuchneri]APR08304.1 hypothetical protein FAM21731_02167 [Lentilactobacillus parabuchneri]
MEKPAFYSVLPANVRYDEHLKANEKILYSEITALCTKDGTCWASNNYFAKLYHVSTVSISTWINHLKKLGYVSVTFEYETGTKRIAKRIIEAGTKVSAHAKKLRKLIFFRGFFAFYVAQRIQLCYS